ncbi:MAG: ATP-binding protein [Spirochaetes bacterium]|nr:ATP-binding protein [Spirochaetota bacterium]
MKQGVSRAKVFYLVSVALAFGAIFVLVVAFVIRDQSTRRLGLEFDIFRLASAMTEGFRDDGEPGLAGAPVIGFGLYDERGKSLVVRGSAPPELDPRRLGPGPLSVSYGSATATLVRRLGMRGAQGAPGMPGFVDAPGPRGLPGEPGRGRMMGGAMMRGPNVPGAGFGFIEIDVSTFLRERRIVYGGAAFFCIILAALAWLLVSTLGRYETLRENEERNRELVSLGEAARTLAHEIKNPLGVIRVHCGILRKNAPGTWSDNVRVIEEETLRVSGLVDRIREYLKSDDGKPAEVDADAFARSLAERWGDRVKLAGSAACTVVIDPDRLRAAADNLVRNALEAQESVGAVGPVRVDVRFSKGRFELSISDRGPGVGEGERSSLFEPFFTTKEKGTGLGLALSRKNISRAGGTIGYSPGSGGGSVFTIRLSAKPAHEGAMA